MEGMKSVSEKMMSTMKMLLVSYLFSGLLMLLLAMILCKVGLTESKVEIGVLIIYLISTLLGGYGMGKVVRVQKYLWGLVLGISYFAMLLLVTLCVSRSLGDVHIASTMLLCMAGGTIGGMIA